MELTPEQESELKSAFQLFDSANTGVVPATELGTLVRALGEAPTEQKLKEVLTALNKGEGGTLSFADVLTAVKRIRAECPRPSAADLETAFRTLDKSGTGFIAIAELKTALTTLGEPLDEAELDAVIAEIDVQPDGRVACATLARLLSA